MNVRWTGLCAAILLSQQAFSNNMTNDNWQFSLELYGQFANIEGDARVGPKRVPTADVDISTSDIFDTLNAGFMFHHEGIYQNTWGYSIDYGFMDLGKTITDGAEAEVFQGILEVKGFKRYPQRFGYFDVMAGIRWWDNDLELTIPALGVDRERNYDWVDYVIGGRMMYNLSPKWRYHLTGDFGGSSDTDLTFAINTGFHYLINDNSYWNLAVKSTWVDYDDEEEFAYDTASYGALIGFGFEF